MSFFKWFRNKYPASTVEFVLTGGVVIFAVAGMLAMIGFSAGIGWMMWPYLLMSAVVVMSGTVWLFWHWAEFMRQVLTDYRAWRQEHDRRLEKIVQDND